jgi:tRNA (guanine37-N1)-methyltransferase
LRVDVADKALETVDPGHQAHRILLSPDGERLSQGIVKNLAAQPHLVLLSGRYEGFDQRIEKYVDQKISIGDFVVSGGELPAAITIDAIIRLLPGALGNAQSLESETFENDVTDFPQFTRPEVYDGQKVPDVLLSGHHAEIEKWRQAQQQKTN